jgi:phospholipid/cholesterol/gamma-HCH transport system ATP-binding protein
MSEMNQAPVFKIANLKKAFGKNKVLDGIDMEVAEGQSIAIIGASGSGKSVLLKTIIGLIIPDADSSVLINGKDYTYLPIGQRPNLLSKFGMLFQGGALFDSMKVWQNISFYMRKQHKISIADAKELAINKLAMVGMSPDVAELFPAELSGGMQKRVALARAIAANPRIIFFDEPTSGLDPIMSGMISELISKLSRQLGATTITISHDMECVRRVADQVNLLYKGKIVWSGAGKELDHSNNPYVDQFIHGKPYGPFFSKI